VGVGAVQISGVLFGLIGIVGTWYQKKDYIVNFNIWQLFRLAVAVAVYVVDIPLIMHCEDWVNNVERVTQEHGWNPLMYDIAMEANCTTERAHFFFLSFATFFALVYLFWVSLQCQEFMGRVPKHLLRVPKDLSSGAFYSHSFGERSHLAGTWGKHDYNHMRQGPPPGPPAFEGAGMLI